MKKSQNAESFVGIIVWVFILSFVILWIVNILVFSTDLTTKYNDANRIDILTKNITNIARNMDTSQVKENEIFYIHKNTSAHTYEIYTGSLNENYKYINEIWETIWDNNTYTSDTDDTYTQILWIAANDTSFLNQNQIIRVSVAKVQKR